MANVHPDRAFTWGNLVVVPGTDTIQDALDSSQSSYLTLGDAFSTGFATIGFATPSGLTDDLKWVRGEVRLETRDDTFGGTSGSSVGLSQQPAFSAGGIGGNGVFQDVPGAGTSRFIMGPRSMFLNGHWTVSGTAFLDVNNLRFEIIDYTDPPTSSIVGPSGAVTLTDAGLPAQWTFTSPGGFAYAGWRLQISTDVGGTNIIYTAAGASGLTHTIPAFVLTPYLATPIYVRVSVAQAMGGYLPPDPATGDRQFGVFAQAQFTPTGTITATFGAVRPDDWVDDLDAADRERLGFSHAPEFSAVLYQWDGQASWPLDIISGAVTLDSTQQIRGQCSLVVANPELRPLSAYPIDPTLPLHPFGSYVQIARGVAGKLVALGAFVIDEVSSDVTVSGPSSVAVTGSDFARFLSDARLTYGKMRQTFAAGSYTPDLATKVMTDVVLEAGLTSVVNGSSAVSVAPSYLTKRTDQRPNILDDVCGSIGWWWYADTRGRILFEALPSASATPRYDLIEGATCTIVRQANTLSRADTYDLSVAYDDAGIFVAGAYDSNPDSPIRRGDGDPDTPTLAAGPFSPGGKPIFFSSPLIASLPTAESTAMTNLTRQAVPVDRITLELVPLPDLRPGHVVTVQRTGQSARSWVIEYVQTPLTETERQAVVAYAPVTWIVPVAS